MRDRNRTGSEQSYATSNCVSEVPEIKDRKMTPTSLSSDFQAGQYSQAAATSGTSIRS